MKRYHVLSVILSLILCLSLCFSMLPYTALAEEGNEGETAEETMPLPTEEESGSETTPGDIPENEEEHEWLAKQIFTNTAEEAYTG